jgi:hypothetical protein
LGFFHPIPRDSAWKDVGMRGEYVSSLQYGDRYYEFALSDSGDVLVTNAWVSEGENFFNIEDDRPFVRGYKRQAEMSQRKNHFFNYIIIRNDGTVEIGPRSEWW